MNPVLASFLLYFAFITFPLIPAIIIYKMFPDTKVGADGLLGNLKINATGAFAAYIITSVISFFVVQYIQNTITASNMQTWTVSGKVVFSDQDGKPIVDNIDKLVEMTQIYVKPDPFIIKNAALIKFNVSANGTNFILSFQQKNFMGPTFDLSSDTTIHIDYKKRTIQLGNIKLKKIKQEYTPNKLEMAEQVDGDAPPTE